MQRLVSGNRLSTAPRYSTPPDLRLRADSAHLPAGERLARTQAPSDYSTWGRVLRAQGHAPTLHRMFLHRHMWSNILAMQRAARIGGDVSVSSAAQSFVSAYVQHGGVYARTIASGDCPCLTPLRQSLQRVRATVSLRAVPATGARHSATSRSEIDRRSPCSAMYATAVASIPEPPRQSMAVIDYAEGIRPRGAISHVSFGNMFFGHASLTPSFSALGGTWCKNFFFGNHLGTARRCSAPPYVPNLKHLRRVCGGRAGYNAYRRDYRRDTVASRVHELRVRAWCAHSRATKFALATATPHEGVESAPY